MDAASTTSLNVFIAHSVTRMGQQEENISNTGRAVQALVTQVSELTQQLHLLRVPAAPPTPPVQPPPPEPENQPEPRLPTPEGYSGDPDYCRAFLTRCSMHFALQPRTFNREESKVAFVLTLCSKVRKEGRKRTGLAREDSGEFYLQINLNRCALCAS